MAVISMPMSSMHIHGMEKPRASWVVGQFEIWFVGLPGFVMQGEAKHLESILIDGPYVAERKQIPRCALRQAQDKLGMTKCKLMHYLRLGNP